MNILPFISPGYSPWGLSYLSPGHRSGVSPLRPRAGLAARRPSPVPPHQNCGPFPARVLARAEWVRHPSSHPVGASVELPNIVYWSPLRLRLRPLLHQSPATSVVSTHVRRASGGRTCACLGGDAGDLPTASRRVCREGTSHCGGAVGSSW